MAQGDGDGWAGCGRRHRHWGRHGAAGLLISAQDGNGRPVVLLVRRARWAQHGGSWGPPGGAMDSHESPVAAAVRETSEECGSIPQSLWIHGLLRDDHGGWSYQTFLAGVDAPFPVRAVSMETAAARWVAASEVGTLPLHPGFGAAWPVLRQALAPLTLIVDGANVMGSRPDGWWQDRPAAIARLHAELVHLAATGVARLPDDITGPPLHRWFPQVVLVAEGKARAAWDSPPKQPGVTVALAPGSGDDTIAELAASLPGRRIVVTADRQLRERCHAAQAEVVGPRWLTRAIG